MGRGRKLLGPLLLCLFGLSLAANANEPRGEAVRVFPQTNHGARIHCILASPKTARIFTGDASGVIKIWQTATGRLERTIPLLSDGVAGLVLSPDGSVLYAASAGLEHGYIGVTPHFFDIASGKSIPLPASNDEEGDAESLDGYPWFSQEGKHVYLTSLPSDPGAKIKYSPNRLFRISDGKAIVDKNPPEAFVATIKKKISKLNGLPHQDTDSNIFENFTVRNEKMRRIILADTEGTNDCPTVFDADKEPRVDAMGVIETAAYPAGIKFRSATQAIDTRETASVSGPTYFDLTEDMRFLVSGHPDGSVRLWDLSEGRQLSLVQTGKDPINDVKLVKDSYSADGKVEVLALSAGPKNASVLRVDFSSKKSTKVWSERREVVYLRIDRSGHQILLDYAAAELPKLGSVIEPETKAVTAIELTGYDPSEDIAEGILRLSEDGKRVAYGGRSYELSKNAGGIQIRPRRIADTPADGRELYESLVNRQRELDTIYLAKRDARVSSLAFQDECCNGGLYIVRAADYGVVGGGSGMLRNGQYEGDLKIVASDARIDDELELSGLLGVLGTDILAVASSGTIALLDLNSLTVLGEQRVHGENISAISRIEGSKRLVTAASDGTISLFQWDAGTRELIRLIDMYALPKGEWLTMTRDGFFTGSRRAGQFVNAVHGNQIFSVAQFYDALARADLVKALLDDDPLRDYAKTSSELDLSRVLRSGPAPDLQLVRQEILEGGQAARVTITAKDNGGGVGAIVWRVNNVTQNVQGRAASVVSSEDEIERVLDLAGGVNEISVTAYNRAGLIRSAPLTVSISGANEGDRRRGRLFILAAGINDYEYDEYRLARARDDALAISQRVATSARGVFDDIRTKTLVDAEVTRAGLARAFDDLSKEIEPDDKFVFFLAGHGKTINGQYFFIGQDFNPSKGRDFESASIRQDQWQEWFASIKARASVLIYDTCEAGTATRAMEARDQAFDKLSDAVGRNVLSATSDTGLAIDSYEGNGLFTFALLRSFSDGDLDQNGQIDVNEMAVYAGNIVPKISKANTSMIQRPWSRIEADFPIGIRLAKLAPHDDPLAEAAPDRFTHFAQDDAPIFGRLDGSGPEVGKLNKGDGAFVFAGDGEFVRVARKGKVLGYVRRVLLQQLN